ncbi:hypothetical protein N7448_000719 [Penicillium atrosanguineum]|uniref:Uncharacterized protein n=1 Tax=Penicillium atrosanguineum TaxID=1132637 RepID=A0A9W9U8B0_9EURO|nr:hypothetical protein N7448_000719 [Penicillium atrosanguineum]KAJ5323927.1 hypothetical protein N7476_002527 [Penicillium atrosanguineum]
MAESSIPDTLNSVFDASLQDRYDPVRLTSESIVPIFELPLAKKVLGHDADSEAIARIADASTSYTTFVAENARAILQSPCDGLTVKQTQSQILHIGLAALFSFLQSNVTGPPLTYNSAETVLPSALRSDVEILRAVRAKNIRDLTVDGEAAYKLTPNSELFSVAKALLVDANTGESVVAKTASMRVSFLHQKMLSEVTSTLQDSIYKDVEALNKADLTADEKGRFLLERAIINTHHGFDAKARADLDQACQVRNFEFALTGQMGKRTKFQERDTSQLVVLAKSTDETPKSTDASGPKTVDLDDDTLLEAISFTESKATNVQDELSPALQSVDPNDQPILNPVDSAILLAMASAITNTAPENGLTREETQPYATRVLEGGSSNWQIYTQALLVRSRVEGFRSRTVERSVLQMQALVDQVIADTATDDSAAQQPSAEPTTFLPRPEKSESASASDRLEYVWLMNFSTRWNLESELAKRWVELGGLRTALEIYERLQMWAEAALCYAATDNEAKARSIVRRQLYEATGSNEDDENEQFDGPERSPSTLPADAPRLFCILGDIEKDEKMYERAWEISGSRYARAQRSLARHYLALTPPDLLKAEDAYRKSLAISRLNHSAWFALGCVQLELEHWEDSTDSFTHCVKLDDADGEAWSNLAASMLRSSAPEPTPDVDVDENNPDVDPHKRKREALSALLRAAQLKHSNARIWDNVLTVAASIPPPSTPFRDIITAQKRIIELLGAKKGEKCVDGPILAMLVDFLCRAFDYDSLFTESESDSGRIIRSGTLPGQILSLIDDHVVPLITHSAALWLVVSRVEVFRERPAAALEAHEKSWRATVANNAQGAFQMGDEKPWLEIVRSTEKLVREGYAKYGPMDRENQQAEGDKDLELVASDWRFKARSAVRGILGKGKDFWEDSEGWTRLKTLQGEVTGN